ncbi:hypothetical protein [Planctomicrobium piriforme]|uniref:Uncharacterized protein n=1 Tax=Planctomicrobium piriforme TaxID=1576369 RepID=A0A1I3RN44_9PLAN|nr:hypothetical protein [Planctomicrobium piriforme]SFJ46626.1 hypothetical protein SAMN05421753_12128 [Planctomicrobium piriforme]
MPDPVRIAAAVLVAGLVAGFVTLIAGRVRSANIRSAVAVLGVVIGFYLGCLCLGVKLHWPPREDQDRFLWLLVPLAITMELIALRCGRWQWLPRLLTAGVAGWILLHGSIYLSDLAGPGSREWSTGTAVLVVGGLAATLFVATQLLILLANHTGGRVVMSSVAIACGGAAVTVMLSGYATGGQPGFPLAATLMAVVLASLVTRSTFDASGATGLGMTCLFAILLCGRFFGELSMSHAAVLLLAPLCGWAVTLPWLRTRPAFVRTGLQLLLTTILVIVVLALAQQNFAASSAGPAPTEDAGGLGDYMNFGK